jgi:hypothetical protein
MSLKRILKEITNNLEKITRKFKEGLLDLSVPFFLEKMHLKDLDHEKIGLRRILNNYIHDTFTPTDMEIFNDMMDNEDESVNEFVERFYDNMNNTTEIVDVLYSIEELLEEPRVYVFRLISLSDESKLDRGSLGTHWTNEPSLLWDEMFRRQIGYRFFKTDKEESDYVLYGIVDASNIDFPMTLDMRIEFPLEQEVSIAGATVNPETFDELYFARLDDMDKINPMNSKFLKQLI